MSCYEAAVFLVEIISDLRAAGYDDEKYHEAVAVACGVLMQKEREANNVLVRDVRP